MLVRLSLSLNERFENGINTYTRYMKGCLDCSRLRLPLGEIKCHISRSSQLPEHPRGERLAILSDSAIHVFVVMNLLSCAPTDLRTRAMELMYNSADASTDVQLPPLAGC